MAGAQHYTDLIVWTLADEMRVEVFKLTRRPAFVRDFKLRSQTDDAMDSVYRNIAEGFACRSHLEFARFLEFSRRSLNEVIDCLRQARGLVLSRNQPAHGIPTKNPEPHRRA